MGLWAALRPGFRRFKGFRRFRGEGGRLLRSRGFLRFLGLTGLWPEGCGIALRVHSEHDWQEQSDAPIIVSRFPFRGDEFYNSAPRNGKPYNRACGAWKCTPFGTFGTTFPPEGELLAVQCIEVLMRPKAERKANFPLRGKSPQGNRGAFPSRHRRGRMVFPLLLPNMQIISPAQHQRGPAAAGSIHNSL